MSELNREQIIKALECCTRGRRNKDDRPCNECPYNECNLVGGTSERQIAGTCQGWLMKDALSLIKELTEENEKLRNDRGALCSHLVCAEIEKRNTIADTVQKMKDRLDKHFCHDPAFLGVEQRLIMDVIVQIAKEILLE